MANRIAIVTPVFNDWAAVKHLISKIDTVVGILPEYAFDLICVNDGSNDTLPEELAAGIQTDNITNVEIINLVCNLGHQRAIAIGLNVVNKRGYYDSVIIMDSDGEDVPADISKLASAHKENPQSVIVAKRIKRSEGLVFNIFYFFYKMIFRTLTGKIISFGNFSLIPKQQLSKLVHLPELWNNYAATLIRSRIEIMGIPTERGKRFCGTSKMNFVSLMIHGLSAISVYSDTVFVRVLLFSLLLVGLTILGIFTVIFIRFFTTLAIPGWATYVIGFMVIILLQALMLSSGALFIHLQGRSNVRTIPSQIYETYITNILNISTK